MTLLLLAAAEPGFAPLRLQRLPMQAFRLQMAASYRFRLRQVVAVYLAELINLTRPTKPLHHHHLLVVCFPLRLAALTP